MDSTSTSAAISMPTTSQCRDLDKSFLVGGQRANANVLSGLALLLLRMDRLKLPMSHDFLDIPTLLEIEINTTRILFLAEIRNPLTCDPCFSRVMMYAASPLVSFLNFSGNSVPSPASRRSFTDL